MVRAIVGSVVAAAIVAPAVAWACSGPGAPAAIARATVLGYVLLGAAAVLAGAATWVCARRGVRGGPLAAGWAVVLAHPGIWISARSGDCGSTRLLAGAVFTAAAAVVLGWAIVRAPRPPG